MDLSIIYSLVKESMGNKPGTKNARHIRETKLRKVIVVAVAGQEPGDKREGTI